MKHILLSILLLGGTIKVIAQKAVYNFDVAFNSKNIGTLTASREVKDTIEVKNLRSNTDAKIFMLSVHVESEVNTKKKHGVLLNATDYRHANRGTEDIQTVVKKISAANYKVVKNGNEKLVANNGIKVCVIDLYFNEPIGVKSVFSNTHGEFLALEAKSKGEYQLTLPDGKKNVFTYTNGTLAKVVSRLAVGEIVFTRKK